MGKRRINKKLFAFIFAGVLIHVLATLDVIFVQERDILGTGATSFLITFISYTVIDKIAKSQESLIEIIAFAIGGAVGSMITVIFI